MAGVGGSSSFGDDDADVCVVVFGFLVGFFGPLGEVEFAAVVFGFDDDAAVVGVADACDVAGVFCAGAYFAVYAVVELVAEVVGDEAFEACAGLFG